jgi:hypothetical protein
MACYRASVNQGYDGRGVLMPVYPPPPTYSGTCASNITYDTLPSGYPMRETILGPNSLKHLYRGPWYYPLQKMSVPDNSMYDFDTKVRDSYGEVVSYGSKQYPYQHRHPREVSEPVINSSPLPNVAMVTLPNQLAWTRYHTVRDGVWGR